MWQFVYFWLYQQGDNCAIKQMCDMRAPVSILSVYYLSSWFYKQEVMFSQNCAHN